MENVKVLFEQEIVRGIDRLKNLKPEDPAYKAGVEAIATLERLKIEEDKVEFDDRKNGDELELKIEEQKAHSLEMAIEKRKFTIRTMVDILAIIIPTALYAYFGVKGFQFEQSGTFCSHTNKQNLGNIFRFRK